MTVDIFRAVSPAAAAVVIRVGDGRAYTFVLKLAQMFRRRGHTVVVQRCRPLVDGGEVERDELDTTDTLGWVGAQSWSGTAPALIRVGTPALSAGNGRHVEVSTVVTLMCGIGASRARAVSSPAVPTLYISSWRDPSSRWTLEACGTVDPDVHRKGPRLIMGSWSRDALFAPKFDDEVQAGDSLRQVVSSWVAMRSAPPRLSGRPGDDGADAAGAWWHVGGLGKWMCLGQPPAGHPVVMESRAFDASSTDAGDATCDRWTAVLTSGPFPDERLLIGVPSLHVRVPRDEQAAVTARLIDLDADGVATAVCHGPVAGCDGRAGRSEVRLDLPPTAWLFARGHRIRVDLAGVTVDSTPEARLVAPIVPASSVHLANGQIVPDLAGAERATGRPIPPLRPRRGLWYRLWQWADAIAQHQFGAPEGALGFAVGAALERFNRELNEWTRELLAARSADHVLEIGFGPGASVQALARTAERVTGIDVSRPMVRKAARRNGGAMAGGRVRLLQASAADLPFAADVFDRVVAVNSVQVWPRRASSLADVRRVLKPGGVLALSRQPKFGMTVAALEQLGQDLVRAVAAAGFDDVSLRFKSMRAGHAVCVLAVKPLARPRRQGDPAAVISAPTVASGDAAISASIRAKR